MWLFRYRPNRFPSASKTTTELKNALFPRSKKLTGSTCRIRVRGVEQQQQGVENVSESRVLSTTCLTQQEGQTQYAAHGRARVCVGKRKYNTVQRATGRGQGGCAVYVRVYLRRSVVRCCRSSERENDGDVGLTTPSSFASP